MHAMERRNCGVSSSKTQKGIVISDSMVNVNMKTCEEAWEIEDRNETWGMIHALGHHGRYSKLISMLDIQTFGAIEMDSFGDSLLSRLPITLLHSSRCSTRRTSLSVLHPVSLLHKTMTAVF
jgi:hypothetical protein